MLTTLLIVHAVTLIALIAFARYDVIRLDDDGRPAKRHPAWREQVIPVTTPLERKTRV